MLLARFAVDVPQAAQTIKGAQGILRTSWDRTWHILEKAVARGKACKTKKVATTIRERIANVVSSYTHEITNALAEGMNSKIMPT